LVVVVDILASNVYFSWPSLEAVELNPLDGMKIFQCVEFQIPVHLTAQFTETAETFV
jgi:hypothetical protein